MMKKLQFTDDQRFLIEKMQVPLAIYQFLDNRVVTLALSDGFLEIFGYQDRSKALFDMNNDMYKNTHSDDMARIAEAAYRFAVKDEKYDVIYRSKREGESEYHIIHAKGKHIYTDSGIRLAQVWYTDEGLYSSETDPRGDLLNQVLNNALYEEGSRNKNYYDFLTGLPSMTYFFVLAESGKERIFEEGRRPVFLYLDLCGMKYFNDRHGFQEGDKLLKSFGHLLSETFSNENCSRFSGDHFVVYTSDEDLEDRLHKLFHDCRMMNGGRAIPVHVGIYPVQKEEITISTACDRAKFACDAIRSSFGSGFNYYNQNMHDDADRQQYILDNLDRAMEEGWIQVYYQGIVRAVSGRVCDEEALSRWIDPEKGFLSPADFIPVLEDAGVIYKMDLYVLEQVLKKLKVQEEAGLHLVPQSINLSRSDFDACDIVEEIRKRVDASGLSRDLITIEITESIIGSDFDFMKNQVRRFRDLGFSVWMDDFGSGYSSLDVLQDIKFNLMKFDMSFMQNLEEGDSKIILTELMKLATALGVDTVCEGVETEAQVRFLQEIGCSKLQGYYFAKPSPMEKILERYERGIQIGFENPEESSYYELIGRVNLYDISVIASDDDAGFHNYFNSLPMGIMEVNDGGICFIRTNQPCRDFMRRFFGHDITKERIPADNLSSMGSSFLAMVKRCCQSGNSAFFDQKMQDGSTAHSFARRIGINPVTGTNAVAFAILSITDSASAGESGQGTTYENIARALTADYINIFYVDLDTEQFIEYSSPAGEEELAMERHGEDFFAASRRDACSLLHEDDREGFIAAFTKENIIDTLERKGTFTFTYRLIDTGSPVNASMKIMRMPSEGNHLIIGVSRMGSFIPVDK